MIYHHGHHDHLAFLLPIYQSQNLRMVLEDRDKRKLNAGKPGVGWTE